jgi:hypothetical protein
MELRPAYSLTEWSTGREKLSEANLFLLSG